MDETISWKDLTNEQLFAMAKWHEARAEAFKEVIGMLTSDPEAVQYRIEVPGVEQKGTTDAS